MSEIFTEFVSSFYDLSFFNGLTISVFKAEQVSCKVSGRASDHLLDSGSTFRDLICQ